MNRGEFVLVNAFTGPSAKGNQCCVLCLEDLSDDRKLHDLAFDFNLPATSFIKRIDEENYEVRWFAPGSEIGLCGHGTIAASEVLFQDNPSISKITFHYQGGQLEGIRETDGVSIIGQPIISSKTDVPEHVQKGFRGKATAYYTSNNKNIVLFESYEDVLNMKPDWEALRKSSTFGYVVTAPGRDTDFVSRVFLPYVSFLEDQATGSAHMLLTPFWSAKLNKESMTAHQLSERGGKMTCVFRGNSVQLSASAVIFGRGILND